jgi:hypothetical protein
MQAGPRSEEVGFAHDSALEEAVKSEPVSPEAKSLQAEKTKREFP